MQEKELNPDQAKEIAEGLVREILEQTHRGATFFDPEVYDSIRKRAREIRPLIQPLRDDSVSGLCEAIKSRKRTLAEAKALVTHIFGSKRINPELFQRLELAQEELGIALDIEMERLLQLDRRLVFDRRLVAVWNEEHQPEVLEASMEELRKKETFWLRALSGLGGDMLDGIRNIRVEADTHEAAIEQLVSDIVTLNSQIHQLKFEARRANDERVIEIADNVQGLAVKRDELRSKVWEHKEELRRINYGWILSHEGRLENEADVTISALEAISVGASEIKALMTNPLPQDDTEVPVADKLNIQAEAYINVALRIRERIPGRPKYKREALDKIARGLEEQASILEV